MLEEEVLKNKKKTGKFLAWIERVGNKIPHPFILFIWLIIIVWIASFVFAYVGTSVVNPIDGKTVAVKSLISAEGIVYMLKNMIKNFTGFAPLGIVLTMTLGIGLAERVGFLSALMRNTILGASPKVVTFVVMLIGICGSIASDAAIVIIPAIAATLFASMGRHPLAGIALGYASTSAGFSANLIIVGTDALLSGISTEAIQIVNKDLVVTPVDNWYFMFVSTFVLAIVGTLICEKIIEPRLGTYKGNKIIGSEEVSPEEKKGLKKAGIGALIYIGIILIVILPKNSFLRNPKTRSLIPSPFLSSIIPIILILFIILSYIYGKEVGKIKSGSDIPKYMSLAIEDMSSYIVLVFIIAQFIAYFNWSNLGYVIAVNGVNKLNTAQLTGIPLFIMFILLTSFINLFIGSASAKWLLLAPIFIPVFYMLGYNPALTQMLYRIGDSTSNIISPISSYFPIILKLSNRYDKKAGVGTILSVMIPYSLIMLGVWTALAMIWFVLGLPLGPNVPIR